MHLSLSEDDRKLLRSLRRLGEATVCELCREMNVKQTAVRLRLGRLESCRLIERQPVRSGRGRPHYVYRVTEAGFRRLGDDYDSLAVLLWRQMSKIGNPQVRDEVLARLRGALVERYRGRVSAATPGERLRELHADLSERGFDVELDETDDLLPVLRENHCPYYEIASTDPEICELERAVFSDVLGTDVELRNCCRNGDHCCDFHVVTQTDS